MTNDNRHLYNQIDNRYLVGALTQVGVGRSGFTLSYHPLQKAHWQNYPPDDRYAPEALIDSPDTVCYFALQDEQALGQVVLTRHWNHLALMYDLRVDVMHRRQGIAKALIDKALDWAKKQGLEGIMLETQDTNPVACQFYESVGFQLGGVDRFLYSAFPEQQQRPPALRDTALFFYRLF